MTRPHRRSRVSADDRLGLDGRRVAGIASPRSKATMLTPVDGASSDVGPSLSA
jgi:hypothetical protein